jgi:hypothetical protein
MGAIADTTGESRAKELYEAGEWERGGFFKV